MNHSKPALSLRPLLVIISPVISSTVQVLPSQKCDLLTLQPKTYVLATLNLSQWPTFQPSTYHNDLVIFHLSPYHCDFLTIIRQLSCDLSLVTSSLWLSNHYMTMTLWSFTCHFITVTFQPSTYHNDLVIFPLSLHHCDLLTIIRQWSCDLSLITLSLWPSTQQNLLLTFALEMIANVVDCEFELLIHKRGLQAGFSLVNFRSSVVSFIAVSFVVSIHRRFVRWPRIHSQLVASRGTASANMKRTGRASAECLVAYPAFQWAAT